MVVDDDVNYANHLAELLEKHGQVDAAYCVEDFFSKFTPFSYDLILLDLRLKRKKEGLEILKHIRNEDPSVTVIVISAYGDIATAVEALKIGARTFLEKDKNSPREIVLISEHVLREIERERRLRELTEGEGSLEIIGEDPKMVQIRKLASFAAQDGEISVLLRGEPGVGKHHVAMAIYSKGKRKEGPFVPFTPLDLSEDDVRDGLFSKERPGAIFKAHRGVLAISDITHLNIKVQARLYEILESGKGPDFQFIAITDSPIEKMQEEGGLHRGLFYRLKTFEIHITPLRERRGDIPLLARYFISGIGKRMNVDSISPEALEALGGYNFPGNVAELKSALETAALRACAEGVSTITTRHLPIPLVEGESPFQIGADIRDIQRFLAEVELYLVDRSLKEVRWRKNDAGERLGYPNRFSMLKRVRRHFEKYPELKARFRKLAKAYKIL